MELELVGKCGCNCSESSSDNCFCLICLAIVVVALIVIALIGYLAYSKYLKTKIQLAEDERKFIKDENEKKRQLEEKLEAKQNDRKEADLERRIREFKEITYRSAILSKVDNKKMTAEEVVSIIEELKNKVDKIEECLNKDKNEH